MRSAAILAVMLCVGGAPAPADAGPRPERTELRAAGANDVSAQARRTKRSRVAEPRARTRFEVRPLRGPLSGYTVTGPYDTPSLRGYRRECVPVFEERSIPQWGGSVLYASQSCRWVRG